MRRFRSFRRGARPAMQWVPYQNFTPQTVAGLGTGSAIILSSVAGETAGQPNIARMTVRAIRGEVHVVAGVGAGIVQIGIAAVTLGTGGTIPALSMAQADLDYPWMFLTTMYLESSASGRPSYISDFVGDNASRVFVRTKRVLRPQEAVVLYFANNTAGTVSFYSQLRSCISRVA